MECNNGYIIEIEYVRGVHRELAPSALNTILLIQKIEPVALQHGFTYCDLGCGHGESITLFAACHPEGEFHAVDFNSAHIAGARDLAAQTELKNITFWEESFADLGKLPLPAFDFIVLHGVYTWVDVEARRNIIEFIRTGLKPGGVVYLSYNSLPGWSAHAPLRKLLISYADTQSGSLEQRIELAIAFVERLKTERAAFFEASPATGNFFEYVCTLPRNYLAHEFFNHNWDLFYHADVVQHLAGANLSFTGSANFAENQDMLRFSESQQQILDGITDKVMRETAKDFAVNLLLRRDLFTGGRTQIPPSQQLERFLGCRFALVVPPAQMERKALFPIGEVLFDRELYDPILHALELKPCSPGELLRNPETSILGMTRLLEAFIVLLSAGYLMSAVEPAPDAVLTAERLNRELLVREIDNPEKQFLASPVLQNALKVEWLERLFILCEMVEHPDPLIFVREKVEARRYARGSEGDTPLSGEENLALQLETFRSSRLPQLRQLGIL